MWDIHPPPKRSPTARLSVTTPPARTRRFDLRRLYTAAALIPAVYVIIVHLAPWALTLLLIAVGSIALLELYRLGFQSRLNRVLVGVGIGDLCPDPRPISFVSSPFPNFFSAVRS